MAVEKKLRWKGLGGGGHREAAQAPETTVFFGAQSSFALSKVLLYSTKSNVYQGWTLIAPHPQHPAQHL